MDGYFYDNKSRSLFQLISGCPRNVFVDKFSMDGEQENFINMKVRLRELIGKILNSLLSQYAVELGMCKEILNRIVITRKS